MRVKPIAVSLCFSLLLANPVFSDVIVYPAKGQSAEQTEKDKYECYQWAKGQTGFDPMAAPVAQTAPPPGEKEVAGAGKSGLAGGLGGAAVGALLGGKMGAGRGALIGGGSGALIGGMRRHDQKEREDHNRRQWEQQEAANYAQNRSDYNRAYSACLSGRGYTVN